MNHLSRKTPYSLLAGLLLGLLFGGRMAIPAETVESFHYAGAEEARAQWTARDGSPPVDMVPVGSSGMLLTLPFASTDSDRVYWDREVELDLSRFASFELDLDGRAPHAIRAFMLYFRSGDGWYVGKQTLKETGRQRLRFARRDFSAEGTPAGWDSITGIRLSPWKGAAVDTTVTLFGLSASEGALVLVQGTTSTPNKAERTYARRVTQRLGRWLTDMHLPHLVVTDEELNEEVLRRTRLVVLGYQPEPGPALLRNLRAFVKRGGKLVVFYSSSQALGDLMGVKVGAYKRVDRPGTWSAMTFSQPGRWHVPKRVYQESLNIRPVYPASKAAQTIAAWESAGGRKTGDPAVVHTPAGFWITHVMLEGDTRSKQRMLLGLLAELEPELWQEAARRAVSSAGRVNSWPHYRESRPTLMREASRGGQEQHVQRLLEGADTLHRLMLEDYRAGRFPQSIAKAYRLRDTLVEAYARTRSAPESELRGVWEHDGVGWFPGDWNRSCRILGEHGINALFANMLWGGVAHHPSGVLPTSKTFALYGDQTRAMVAAARKHGLEAHVWKVCWNLEGSPASFREKMKREGRLFVDAGGTTHPWLSPAHPENVNMALESLKEVAERYPIRGLHLDYIRFPEQDGCYSEAARKRFEEWLGRPVPAWPGDARAGGSLRHAFLRFRTDQVNLLVRAVHQQVRPLRPGLKISAAVFGTYPACVASVGQDWKAWLDEGWVDFVVPMNYTVEPSRFSDLYRTQKALTQAGPRILPGIGVSSNEGELTADQVIEQIDIARRMNAPGFVLFDLSHTLRSEILPMLKLGPTRPSSRGGQAAERLLYK